MIPLEIIWSNQLNTFIESSNITSVLQPYRLKVSPDGRFLVTVSQTTSYPNKHVLKTFFIFGDGSLVDTGYTFPYSDTFGSLISDASELTFAYPQAPTVVPRELWQDLDEPSK